MEKTETLTKDERAQNCLATGSILFSSSFFGYALFCFVFQSKEQNTYIVEHVFCSLSSLTLTVTWLSFFVSFIFISNPRLLAIPITIWPVTPCSTITWLVAVASTVLNGAGYCLLGWKFESTVNLMSLIYRFDILESECSILKVDFLWHFQNFNLKSVVNAKSFLAKRMERKKFIFIGPNFAKFWP